MSNIAVFEITETWFDSDTGRLFSWPGCHGHLPTVPMEGRSLMIYQKNWWFLNFHSVTLKSTLFLHSGK